MVYRWKKMIAGILMTFTEPRILSQILALIAIYWDIYFEIWSCILCGALSLQFFNCLTRILIKIGYSLSISLNKQNPTRTWTQIKQIIVYTMAYCVILLKRFNPFMQRSNWLYIYFFYTFYNRCWILIWNFKINTVKNCVLNCQFKIKTGENKQ